MWKRTLLASALFAFLAVPLAALANPPSAIDATYDAKRGELNVLVQHPISDIQKHFIKEVVVTKNGKEVATKTFDVQTSHRNQTMPPFKLEAAPGDTLTVKGTCNLFGSKEVSVDLGPGSK